jgi:uncharacterized protein DUF4375
LVEDVPVNDLDERKLDEYLQGVNKKIVAGNGKDWDCLSDAERTTITAYLFALEVSNGGIEQFFVNPCGDRWRETLEAIKTVGASKLAHLFEQALTVFPNSTPSENQMTRLDQLETAGREAADLLWRLTGEYYDLQAKSAKHCLYQRLTAFAIKVLEGKGEGTRPTTA